MAEDKKGFVLYADLIHTVNQLPDEKAGLLFKHILSYVNDEDPVIDDLIITISFEPIKQQLKRDLKKYESICNRNALNGSKGGRPSNPKEPKEPSGFSGNPKEPKKADTDTDTDSDTDTGKGKGKDIKKKPSLEDFLLYCGEIENIIYKQYEFSLIAKYNAWVANGWKDGNDSIIKNWKSKIQNTIPYLKPDLSIAPAAKPVLTQEERSKLRRYAKFPIKEGM